jgi:hypothetical protein
MRRLPTPALFATAFIALACAPANAQQPRPGQMAPGPGQMAPGPGQMAPQRPQAAPQQPQQQPQTQSQAPAPAKPYKPIAVSLPAPSNDPGFAAFRKQLGDIAQKKDRAALARLVVAKDFFWEGESGDKADKKKSTIDNLGAALGGFTGPEAGAWDTLASAASEPTMEPFGDKKDVMCSPASPQFDEQAFEAVTKDTGTDLDEWAFPTAAGIDVRGTGQPNAPVIEKLGMNLVRVLPDQPSTSGAPSDAPPFIRVVTPSGKTGFVPADAVASLVSDQLCYLKDAGGWKITGFVGSN